LRQQGTELRQRSAELRQRSVILNEMVEERDSTLRQMEQERDVIQKFLLHGYLKIAELNQKLYGQPSEPSEPVDGRRRFWPGQPSEIRRAFAAGEASMNQLAKRYCCSPSTIHKIIHGHTWKKPI